ncbi:MAG: DNA polymerase IV [Oscillospiraceae bacterium]|nr:DNA polymerase IV [Oscillospiraceae bacterium]
MKEDNVVGRRVVLHADMNNCYASIEMLYHPKLRGHPVAVGGNAEQRHGIILARNYEARPYGVRVGQALWEARKLCPNLIIVPPDYEKYLRFSRYFKDMLSEYSPQVEPFGLDESWVDVTGCLAEHSTGENLANELRERAKTELGITISVGVSYNKIFAKLGSDMKKPDATTVINEDNYRNVVWPLPVEDLLGVGRATKAKLVSYGVRTIGDLAQCDTITLKSWFHKWGLFLHTYANGYDSSPVAETGSENMIKSIGNSTTCPRDLLNDEDAHIVFQNLAESVSERMREQGLMAKTVQISLRTNDLFWFERQMPLPKPSHISTELCDVAMQLLRQNWDWNKPLRSIGIRGTNLTPIIEQRQLSLFEDEQRREKFENLEFTIDGIRRRFGHYSIDRAMLLLDSTLGNISPVSDHVIHPVGYMN